MVGNIKIQKVTVFHLEMDSWRILGSFFLGYSKGRSWIFLLIEIRWPAWKCRGQNGKLEVNMQSINGQEKNRILSFLACLFFVMCCSFNRKNEGIQTLLELFLLSYKYYLFFQNKLIFDIHVVKLKTLLSKTLNPALGLTVEMSLELHCDLVQSQI